jgi:hypothetical protein
MPRTSRRSPAVWRAIAEGFRLVYHADHELLKRELSVYDALYAYCRALEERKEPS